MESEFVSADTQRVKKAGVGGMRILSMVLILAALLSSSVVHAQFLGSAPPPSNRLQTSSAQPNPGILARNLIGSRVQSDRGDDLGTVSDILIDPGSGRLDFVIIASGSFIGRKLKPVPPDLLSTATAKRGVVEAGIESDAWKTAPSFAKSALPNLRDPAAARRIYAFYDHKRLGSAAPTESKADRKASHHSRSSNHLEFGNSLLGKELFDQNGQRIARITDVLVDLRNPQVTFAIVRRGVAVSNSSETSAVQRFAVPVNDLRESSGSERLVLSATANDFQHAPPLQSDNWATASTPGAPTIYRFQPEESAAGQPASALTRQ